jgi:hypothetical protein
MILQPPEAAASMTGAVICAKQTMTAEAPAAR